jgi:septal ring factor EnvC (AmiA/AmiB activator)
MSVIHEAIKRARGGDKPSPRPALTVQSGAKNPGWIVWAMLAFILVLSALLLRESSLRHRSEEKMKMAYLKLNDERGDFMDKRDTAIRTASELRELKAANLAVEEENFRKEKQVAEIKKKLHESEMERIRLEAALAIERSKSLTSSK